MTSVQGDDSSGLGFGVKGTSTANTGVVGESNTGNGVVGQSDAGNGVLGLSNIGDGVAGSSGQGNGVTGQSKEANGVLGSTNAVTGSGVFGSNKSEGNGVTGLSEFGFGVYGLANQQNPDRLVAGVIGECKRSGWGVLGLSPEGRAAVAGLSDKGDGVLGQTRSDKSAGVRGENSFQQGVGVRGVAPNGVGVYGASNDATILMPKDVGVLGSSKNGIGVIGANIDPSFGIPPKAGIVGIADKGPGVFGGTIDSDFPAVAAWNFAPAAAPKHVAIGAIGDINVLGSGFISLDFTIQGTLQKAGGQFHIDHPLDPANKYLNHANVESSEMKTIYDGIVILDDQGQAVVELPDWFESLNTGFRYQLTPIGAPALNLHIAEEISANRFKIAGGQAGLKVCWLVTGVRQDSFARAQPLVVELDKPAKEQGYYLHPEYHNQPKERGIAWAREPDLMRRVEQIQVSFEDKNKAGEK